MKDCETLQRIVADFPREKKQGEAAGDLFLLRFSESIFKERRRSFVFCGKMAIISPYFFYLLMNLDREIETWTALHLSPSQEEHFLDFLEDQEWNWEILIQFDLWKQWVKREKRYRFKSELVPQLLCQVLEEMGVNLDLVSKARNRMILTPDELIPHLFTMKQKNQLSRSGKDGHDSLQPELDLVLKPEETEEFFRRNMNVEKVLEIFSRIRGERLSRKNFSTTGVIEKARAVVPLEEFSPALQEFLERNQIQIRKMVLDLFSFPRGYLRPEFECTQTTDLRKLRCVREEFFRKVQRWLQISKFETCPDFSQTKIGAQNMKELPSRDARISPWHFYTAAQSHPLQELISGRTAELLARLYS